MTNLATIFARVPKLVLFGAAALIQIALIGLMVADRVMILRTGVDVPLQTRPLDPRDFLRGDYVVLGYDMASERLTGRDKLVFVKLAPNRDGFYEAISAHAAPVDVASPEVLIRGHVVSGVNCGRDRCSVDSMLQVRYGIESYFVPEGEGRKLESARNQRKLTIVAAVAPTGRAAIKRLLIDGEPVYDEPWF
jgi:GDYXXLXY protein